MNGDETTSSDVTDEDVLTWARERWEAETGWEQLLARLLQLEDGASRLAARPDLRNRGGAGEEGR